MRIAVCRPQQPFVRGGAEIFTDTLVAELRARGHEADLVSIPFNTCPNERILTSAAMWRLVDMTEHTGMEADLVVATKFPSYLIEHPNKVVWLVHQFRQAYELDGTEYGQFTQTEDDRAIRDRVEEMDRVSIGGARKVFATSKNVAGRLLRSTGIEAEVLPHPPQELPYRCDRYDPFVLSIGRLDPWKRLDLLIRGASQAPGLEVVIAGDGPDRERLERLTAELGVGGRVRFLGRVTEEALTDLYATCRAVYYAPMDEDFGMVPIEALRARKPVVTATDSGGPLDFVIPGRTGWVTEPTPDGLAAAFAELLASEETARRYGEAGEPAAAAITLDTAIARLLA